MNKNRETVNYNFIIGAVIIASMILLAMIGSFFTPYDADVMNAADKFAPVSLQHWMGCDNFGRDIFSRILKGIRITMLVSAGTVAIGVVFGTLIGSLTGYYGGIADEILMRFNDAVLAFPSFLLALVFVSVMGSGTINLTLALGIVFIPSYARIVRGEVMRLKNLDYVQSARLMGANDIHIMLVHILPNTIGVMLSSIVIGFNNAVLAEAGMSFLGIGVQPPDSSLGRMLSEAQAFLFAAPMYALFPGISIVLLILGFALLSDGIKKL